jgi:hypothetical protein
MMEAEAEAGTNEVVNFESVVHVDLDFTGQYI